MKSALIGLCAALIAGATLAEGPAGMMKPGLWESRPLKMMVDGRDMLPQMKAAQTRMRKSIGNLPPEQRKQMEATINAQQGDPSVQRLCISPEMASSGQAMLPRPEHAGCAEPKLSHGGNRTAFDVSCKQNGGTTTGHGESVIVGDQITSKFESVTTEAGGTRHTMQIETQMTFLGSDCGGLEPLDQIAHSMQAGVTAPPVTPSK
jgi:hypothetical protein